MSEQPVLTTRRLVLRPFVLDDALAVQVLAGAPEVADTTLHIPHPYPAGAAEQWIATHAVAWAAGTGVTYAITDAATGILVGAVGLTITPAHAHAEMGYWVGVPYWNRGYATEAAAALVDFGFKQLGLHRIHAHYLTRNPASGRVMQKLGMRSEGVSRHAVRKNGQFEDLELYAILADEWPGSVALT
ncbi:MAG TPA: GNAT family N-acetyltransferase [Gemmatimonadaceae bacterium]|nr:GNAT family N-acetyltransferase [Gemmatimonadaceae bacterium]